MENKVYLILHFSVLFIAVYYYNKVDKVWLNRAIIAFALYALCAMLKDFLPWKYALSMIALVVMPIAAVFSWIEVSISTSIKRFDKTWILVFLLPVILKSLLFFFKPLMLITFPLALLSLGILIYYTFKYKDSDYLTQEIAVMNLFGIDLILGFVKAFYILYH